MSAQSDKHHFPMPIEILRSLIVALNLKANADKLDDEAKKLHSDHRHLTHFSDELFNSRLIKYVPQTASNALNLVWQRFLENYQHLLKEAFLVGVDQPAPIRALLIDYFSAWGAQATQELAQLTKIDPQLLIPTQEQTAVGQVLSGWLEMYPEWNSFLNACNKEFKDRVRLWRQGREIPSVSSISLLQERAQPREQIDRATESWWATVRTHLLVARTVDHLVENDASGISREALSKHSSDNRQIQNIVRKLQQPLSLSNTSLRPVLHLANGLQQKLKPGEPKSPVDQNESGHMLAIFKDAQERHDPSGHTQYLYNWFCGRRAMLSADPNGAITFYKRALDGCLFRAGQHQENIIKEASVVAACMSKPDKVFLKRLKNASVKLGINLPTPSADPQNIRSRVADHIETWEIESLKALRPRMFPEAGLFPGHSFREKDSAQSEDWLVSNKGFNRSPDLTHPDRMLKIGEAGKQKRLPQLVWFTLANRLDAVEALITHGASPSKLSESNESALLLAVEKMNQTKPLSESGSTPEYFEILSKLTHEWKTLNTPTTKLRKTPLLAAIETGQVEIVKTILELGAEVDLRGDLDNRTPLHACLKSLSKRLEPVKTLNETMKIRNQPHSLEGIRRTTHGRHGPLLNDQERWQETMLADNEQNTFAELAQRLHQQAWKTLAPDNLRAMALLLLQSGANANARHDAPLAGHTPFMLAVEMNEAQLVAEMLNRGGDPHLTYFDPNIRGPVSSWDIARYWSSHAALRELEETESGTDTREI